VKGNLANVNWRNIAITLIDSQKGEKKAQSCENACFQHLRDQAIE
jgi:hypothetical protein